MHSLPVVLAGNDQEVCVGSSVLLSAAGALAYSWDHGVVNGQLFTPTVGNLTYTVTGTDGNNCTNTDQVVITVNDLPTVPVITSFSMILTSSAATSYQWFSGSDLINGETAQTYSPTQSGLYSVEITDSNGCSATSDGFIFTFSALTSLNKTGFIEVSPNPSSGMFSISFGSSDARSIKVFNASGSVVFNSSNPISEIDLTNQSKGVYFLKIETDNKIYITKLVVN